MPDEPTSIEVSPRLLPAARLTTFPPAGDRKPERADSPPPGEAGNRPRTGAAVARSSTDVRAGNRVIHPSWLALIELCRDLGHGEIERLSIQDGLPVLAETVKKKVRFTR